MFESLNEFVLSAIVVLAGGAAVVLIGRWLGRRPLIVSLIYAWHTLLGFYYSNYVLTHGGDALGYFEKARFGFFQPNFGTEFIIWLTSVATGFGFTYWPVALLYNAAGAIGLVFFYAALEESVADTESVFAKVLVFICVFIPSLSFWTSGIGKDSLSLLSVGIFLWSIKAFSRRQVAAIVAVLIMLPIRPHVAAIMVLSVAAGTLFVTNLRATTKFGMGAISAAAAVFAVPLAVFYSGASRFLTLGEFISDRQEHNTAGGSSIDITGMNPVFRLLSYLFRPLPNEVSGFEQWAAAFDNLVLIALTGIGITAMVRAGVVRVFRNNSIEMIYGVALAALLSQVTANLGLAMRQKWMLVPALMVAFVSAWSMMRRASADRSAFRRLHSTPQAMG